MVDSMADTRVEQEEARLREAYARRKELARSQLYTPLVPSTLFTMQTRERVLLKLLARYVHQPLADCRLLDVGCGKGNELVRLIPYGFQPQNLYGIDVLEERVAEARTKHPAFQISAGNAAHLPWNEGYFNVVMQYMMFSSILDRAVLKTAAAEMLRVTAPSGCVISYDMRVTRPDNPDVIPMRKRDVQELFPGVRVDFYSTTLAPPIVRRLAGLSWVLCELLYLVSPLRTHYYAVIRKPA